MLGYIRDDKFICEAFFNNIAVMKEQRIKIDRSKMNWVHTRRALSHISRVADMLFETNSTRLGRATKIERKTIRACATVRKQYKEKLNSLICKRRSEKFKKIVFFGDGDFSSSHKGHVTIPKKKILKSLATRGLTFLLDEYNTSKMCPCGKAELEDVCLNDDIKSNGTRLRCHKKTNGPECKCCVEST